MSGEEREAVLDPVAASEHPAARQCAQHVNPAFVKLLGLFGYGRIFTRARDVWVWDHEERRYLDFLAGFGAVNTGHNHPRLRARVERFLSEESLNLVHVGPGVHEGALAARLAELAADPLEIVLLSNSGAEAVEAGLKLARAATGRPGFVFCAGGFHGTNLATLSVMGEQRMKKPFLPLLDKCVSVPFGDLDALQEALKSRPAAFLLEPIQGEAGVILPPPSYLQEAQRLCQRRGTLLILDEVQTGIGRTGSLFAYEGEEFVPDVLVLGKALGGGLTPISATLTSRRLQQKAYGSMDRFDLHGSTYGGNELACAVALEALQIVQDEALIQNAKDRGEELRGALRTRLGEHPFVRDIRGRGLLVALELGPRDQGGLSKLSAPFVKLMSRQIFGQWAALRLLERQVICQPAAHSWNVLKLEPPLTIQSGEIAHLVETLGDVLDEYRSLSKLLKDASSRLGAQFLSGWSF